MRASFFLTTDVALDREDSSSLTQQSCTRFDSTLVGETGNGAVGERQPIVGQVSSLVGLTNPPDGEAGLRTQLNGRELPPKLDGKVHF